MLGGGGGGGGLMDDETSSHHIFLFMLLLIPFLVIGLSIKANIHWCSFYLFFDCRK